MSTKTSALCNTRALELSLKNTTIFVGSFELLEQALFMGIAYPLRSTKYARSISALEILGDAPKEQSLLYLVKSVNAAPKAYNKEMAAIVTRHY